MTGVPRVLVVVLPGIGGSLLGRANARGKARRDARGGPDLVWSAALDDLALLHRPESLAVDEENRLVPVGLIRTRKVFGLFTAVHGYEGLMRSCAAAVPGARVDWGQADDIDEVATVVAFPYDFRLGVAHAAHRLDEELTRRLNTLWTRRDDQRGRVVFVGHSMGGLVARYWTAMCGRPEAVRALITLGTPHRGAPKALDVLANGYPLWGGHIGRVRELVAGWQGMADLLPTYPCIPGDPDGSARQDLLRPHAADVDWLEPAAGRAWNMHEQIREGWRRLEVPPAVYPRIGYNRATLRNVTRVGNRLTVTSDSPAPLQDDWGSEQGDGTVPAYSALPREMDNYPMAGFRVGYSHGAMVDLDVTRLVAQAFSKQPPGQPFQEDDRPVLTLGVDCPEAWDVGQCPDVTVSVWEHTRHEAHRLDTVPAGIPVVVRVSDLASGARVGEQVRLAWDQDRAVFRGGLAPLPPGVFEVEVKASELTDTRVRQIVEVVDADR